MQVAADPEYFNRQTYELLKKRKKTEMEELQLVRAKLLFANKIFCCVKFVVFSGNS
jgi:hypothetical protein